MQLLKRVWGTSNRKINVKHIVSTRALKLISYLYLYTLLCLSLLNLPIILSMINNSETLLLTVILFSYQNTSFSFPIWFLIFHSAIESLWQILTHSQYKHTHTSPIKPLFRLHVLPKHLISITRRWIF